VRTAPTKASKPAAPNASTRATSAAREHSVEAQLQRGRIVLILFWSPKGADDVAVRHAVAQVRSGKVAVELASAREAAAFGTITAGIQVYGTPTLLIVGPKGKTTTLTGLQDAFAIRQAIQETRQA
jgi:hypothetical protein